MALLTSIKSLSGAGSLMATVRICPAFIGNQAFGGRLVQISRTDRLRLHDARCRDRAADHVDPRARPALQGDRLQQLSGRGRRPGGRRRQQVRLSRLLRIHAGADGAALRRSDAAERGRRHDTRIHLCRPRHQIDPRAAADDRAPAPQPADPGRGLAPGRHHCARGRHPRAGILRTVRGTGSIAMSVRDILLPLVGESSRTTMIAIEKCAALARGLDARVTALAVETEDYPPPSVADVLGAADIVQTAPTARALLAAFATAAKKHSLRNEQRLQRSPGAGMIGAIAMEARLNDISIALVKTADSFSEK